MNNKEINELLNWTSIQSHILTGNNELNNHNNYNNNELPHYYLSNQLTNQITNQWISENIRNNDIVGCWYRPIFSGGWYESTSNDTFTFNLQTPSLFIDIRIPKLRNKLISKSNRINLTSYNNNELKLLARQHCFSGYSYCNNNVYTRHHFIDWTYHKRFPRNKPNKWFIITDNHYKSYKEYSFFRDVNNIPLYYERWIRYDNDSNGKKYLALRRESNNINERDEILIVIGNYFAIAIDRLTSLIPIIDSYKESKSIGITSLVDHVINNNQRHIAEQLLDLSGSFGEVYTTINPHLSIPTWTIKHSTHPWLEDTRLLKEGNVKIITDNSTSTKIRGIFWKDSNWNIIENSFTYNELVNMFTISFKYNYMKARL